MLASVGDFGFAFFEGSSVFDIHETEKGGEWCVTAERTVV